MKLSAISQSGTRWLGRTTFAVKRYSPEILTGVGVAGVVVSAVLASRATLKLNEIKEQNRERVLTTKAVYGDDKQKLTATYAKNVGAVAKLYLPSVTLGVLSIASIVGAHGIMRKRNIALLATVKTLESAYSAYRERVSEQLGEDQERELYHGLREVEEVDPKTGKKVKIMRVADPNDVSVYSKIFDKSNRNHSPNREANRAFVTHQQRYANDKLKAYGYLFLNDVYDSLGFERTKMGAIVGWVIGPDGDNFVDFGLYDSYNAATLNNSGEDSFILDFNVDGVIWDKIPE